MYIYTYTSYIFFHNFYPIKIHKTHLKLLILWKFCYLIKRTDTFHNIFDKLFKFHIHWKSTMSLKYAYRSKKFETVSFSVLHEIHNKNESRTPFLIM